MNFSLLRNIVIFLAHPIRKFSPSESWRNRRKFSSRFFSIHFCCRNRIVETFIDRKLFTVEGIYSDAGLLLLLLKLPLATNFVLLIFPNFGIFVSLSNSDVINKNAFACKVYCKCAIKQVFKIHFSNSWSPLILGRRSNTSHSNLHDRNLFIRDVIFFHESYALDCISCMQNSKKCWSSIIGQFRCPKNHQIFW